jgi:hypothetical protein
MLRPAKVSPLCLLVLSVVIAPFRALAVARYIAMKVDAAKVLARHRSDEHKDQSPRPEPLAEYDPDQGIVLKLSASVPLYLPQPKDLP